MPAPVAHLVPGAPDGESLLLGPFPCEGLDDGLVGRSALVPADLEATGDGDGDGDCHVDATVSNDISLSETDANRNKDLIHYPTLLWTNARSIMPKLECLCSTVEQESVDITFVSELWLKPDNPLHTRELDRRFNLEGLQFFTNSRATQRGGGVGIIINTGKGYSATRLQVNSRTGKNSIEVIWVLVTPHPPHL